MDQLLPAIRDRRAGPPAPRGPVQAAAPDLLREAAARARSHGNTQPTRIPVAESEKVRDGVISALDERTRHRVCHAPLRAAPAAGPSRDTLDRGAEKCRRQSYPLHASTAPGMVMAQPSAFCLLTHPGASFDVVTAGEVFASPAHARIQAAAASGSPGNRATVPPGPAASEAGASAPDSPAPPRRERQEPAEERPVSAPALPVSTAGGDALDTARLCARVARDIIRAGAPHAEVTGVKGRGNVVTETDYAVEHAVMAVLREHFPGHGILSEETASATPPAGWTWVVDPLDGTKNFSRGIAHFAFTLALCRDGEPVLGLTTHPLLGTEVAAVAGLGCTVDGRRTVLRPCPSVADAVVAMDLGYDADRARRQLELAAHLWPGMQSLRIPGSAALGFAGLAAGWWDIYLHSDLQPWDLAAGLLIVREAGGIVVARDGSPAALTTRAVVAGTETAVRDALERASRLPVG